MVLVELPLAAQDADAPLGRSLLMIWLVQLRFAGEVPAAAPDGWVTVAVREGMWSAARTAALVYRDREHPYDGYPNQLRIRAEKQICDDDGDSALAAALESLRLFGELTAQGEGTPPLASEPG